MEEEAGREEGEGREGREVEGRCRAVVVELSRQLVESSHFAEGRDEESQLLAIRALRVSAAALPPIPSSPPSLSKFLFLPFVSFPPPLHPSPLAPLPPPCPSVRSSPLALLTNTVASSPQGATREPLLVPSLQLAFRPALTSLHRLTALRPRKLRGGEGEAALTPQVK